MIDTTVAGVYMGVVGICDGAPAKLLARQCHPTNQGASASLPALLAQLVEAVGDLKIVGAAVAVGPGSFTGIKVGLAFIHGWLRGLGTSVPTESLSILKDICQITEGERDHAVLLPATQDTGFYAIRRNGAVSDGVFRVADTEQQASLKAVATCQFLLPWPAMEQSLAAMGVRVTVLTPEERLTLTEAAMLAAVESRWPDSFTASLPQPRYLRPSRAEERLMEKESQ